MQLGRAASDILVGNNTENEIYSDFYVKIKPGATNNVPKKLEIIFLF